ncbi:MAG: LysE family translocator [Hyphomicrobiaceae bacterium]|nr:LysE family translocator [Hyphomicrobiaceae bacterium]MCC0024773.1 LysE family translocator [Hyphomicrobiaceae bacterium]
MFLLEYIPYVIALGIAAAIPGPGIAASVGKALGSGFRPALYFLNGLVLGDLTYLTFAVLGLSAIATLFSGIFVVIRYLGAAYLLWLAWSFWTAGIDPSKVHAQQGAGFWPSFSAGYMVTMGNPKTIIFYMALLPSVVDLKSVTGVDYAILAVLTVLVLYAVVVPYIALASRARAFLTNPRALRILNRTAASAMAGAAAFIAFRE